ncbi:hypothetical protein D3C87_1430080 [compost metagenome]
MVILGLFVAQQRFAVGDRDLVIVGVNFAEGEEAVAIAAIFDKRRLQGRLNARDLGEVNVAPQLAAGRRFEVELVEPVTRCDDNPCFFRVDGIHQHSLGSHNELRALARRQEAAGRPASFWWRYARRMVWGVWRAEALP